MQLLRELPVKVFTFSKVADCSPATLFNLNNCTNSRTRYSVPEADLGLPQLPDLKISQYARVHIKTIIPLKFHILKPKNS